MTQARNLCLGLCLFGLLTSAANADRPTKESPAIRFARRDAALSAKHLRVEQDKADKAKAKLSATKTRIAGHKKTTGALAAKLKQLQTLLAKTAKDASLSEQALADAKANVARLSKDLAAAQRIATVVERHVKVVAARKQKLVQQQQAINKEIAAAAKQNKLDLAAVKPLTVVSTAASKLATSAKSRADQIKNRLARLQKVKPQADPKNAHLVHKLKHDRIMWSCRFDEQGQHILAGAQDKYFHRWDLATGSKIRMQGHKSWIRRFAFHPKQKVVITGAYEGKLIWWNVTGDQPKKIREIQAHEGYVRGVAISPDGKFVATGGNDTLVKIWSAKSGKLLHTIKAHKRHVYNVAFHPGGKSLITGDLMGKIKQWQVGTWKHERDFDGDLLVGWDTKFQADCGGVRGIDFGPGGKMMAIAGISGVTNAFAGTGKPTVVLYDWKTGKRTQVLLSGGTGGHCWGVRWHHQGDFLVAVCGSGGGKLVFFKPGTKKPIHSIGLPHVAYDVALHPDGLRLAVALYDKSIAIYDLGPKPPKKKKK